MRYVKYGLGLLAFALLVFISWLTLTPAPQGVLVLEYHHVNDDVGNDGWAYTVPVADFAEQLDYLQAEGYTTITIYAGEKRQAGTSGKACSTDF